MIAAVFAELREVYDLTLLILVAVSVVVITPIVFMVLISRRIKKYLESWRRGLVKQLALRETPVVLAVQQQFGLWCQSRGMELLGAFRHDAEPRQIIVVWKCPKPISYFLVFHGQAGQRLAFISAVDEEPDSTLTSSNSDSLGGLPIVDGICREVFSGANADELMRRHAAAQEYLKRVKHVTFGLGKQPFPQILEQSIQRQIRGIRRRGLVSLFYLWWQIAGQHRRINRSIEEQHRSGLWS